MYTVSGIFYTKKKVTKHLLLRTRSVYRNVGKKVTGKKSHGKVTDFGRKKSQRKKSHKKELCFFLNFWLGITFYFYYTIIITLCFVWIDVLAYLCPT